MAIIKWEPFGDIDRFFEEDFLMPAFPKMKADLAIDIYEKDNNIIAEMQVPGVDPKDIDVSVEDGYLKISGSRKEEKEEKKKNYYRKEIKKGSFERAVRLPAEVLGEKAEADYKDGMIIITIPKAKKTKAKKITVRKK